MIAIILALVILLCTPIAGLAQPLPDTPANRARGVVGCIQSTTGITCPGKGGGGGGNVLDDFSQALLDAAERTRKANEIGARNSKAGAAQVNSAAELASQSVGMRSQNAARKEAAQRAKQGLKLQSELQGLPESPAELKYSSHQLKYLGDDALKKKDHETAIKYYEEALKNNHPNPKIIRLQLAEARKQKAIIDGKLSPKNKHTQIKKDQNEVNPAKKDSKIEKNKIQNNLDKIKKKMGAGTGLFN